MFNAQRPMNGRDIAPRCPRTAQRTVPTGEAIIALTPSASTQASPTLPLPSFDLSPAIRALLYVHRFVYNQAQSTRAPLHLLVPDQAWARGSRLPLPKPQPH